MYGGMGGGYGGMGSMYGGSSLGNGQLIQQNGQDGQQQQNGEFQFDIRRDMHATIGKKALKFEENSS